MPKKRWPRWLKTLVSDPEHERQLDFLAGIPAFSGVSRRGLSALLQSLSAREYHKGEALCEAGTIGHFLFLIESGAVAVLKPGEAGTERRAATLGAGALFGEMAVLSDMPRTSTVVALEPVKAFLLYKTEVEKLVAEEPAVAAAILLRLSQLVAARLRAELGTKARLS